MNRNRRSNLIVELALKATSNSVVPRQQHDEDINPNNNAERSLVNCTSVENEDVSRCNNGVQLDTLTNKADEETSCEPVQVGAITNPNLKHSLADLTMDSNDDVKSEPNSNQLRVLRNETDGKKARDKAIGEIDFDTSTVPSSVGSYILVPSGEDNCFLLEPNYEEPNFLSEVNCVVFGKSPEQQSTEADIDGNSLQQTIAFDDMTFYENLVHLDNDISSISFEDRVAHVEDNTILFNDDKEDEDGNNIDKTVNKRRRKDKEEDKLYIPSDKDLCDVEHLTSNEEIINVPDNDQSNSKEISPKKKRAKRGKANRDLWVANVNKQKKCKGEEYFGRRKTEEGKTVFDVKRPKKNLKPCCTCPSKNVRSFLCTKISDPMRQKIFSYFYSLNKGEKRIFVKSLVEKKPVKQRTVASPGTSRRNHSLVYFLKPDEANERIKVCKRMFLNTLGIGEWAVHDWVSIRTGQTDYDHETNEDDPQAEEDDPENQNKRIEKRRSLISTEDQTTEERKLLSEFFEMLPKLESHYCRKSSTKQYLEPNWQSKAQLFREYKDFCKSKNKENHVTSIFTFHTVFNDYNLGLFSPKKDQCDVCSAYKTGNLSEKDYRNHIMSKDKARDEKEKDKSSTDEKTSVFTMDLQAVLLSPALKASALYYRTKLKVHNFTIFDLKTGAGFCYLWDETEGGLNADEFATILHHFLTTEVNRETCNNVIIFSDGCTYQNRNAIIANTLLLVSKKMGITITQKFLEKGHTQMECDSMHSCIERRLKNREIYSPVAYTEACRTARLNPSPYKVQYLQHSFFLKFSDLQYVTSMRPGNKKGDPVVTNLKCIKYTTEGEIKIKLDLMDEFSDLPRRIKSPTSEAHVKCLYKDKIPLQTIKFKHLQEMKSVLPRQVHEYYDTLPHMAKYTNKLCEKETCSCIIPVIVDF